MKKAYDFSKGKRGAVKRFRAQSERTGKGYQTLMNEALKSYLGLTEQPITPELVRKIVREQLAANG